MTRSAPAAPRCQKPGSATSPATIARSSSALRSTPRTLHRSPRSRAPIALPMNPDAPVMNALLPAMRRRVRRRHRPACPPTPTPLSLSAQSHGFGPRLAQGSRCLPDALQDGTPRSGSARALGIRDGDAPLTRPAGAPRLRRRLPGADARLRCPLSANGLPAPESERSASELQLRHPRRKGPR